MQLYVSAKRPYSVTTRVSRPEVSVTKAVLLFRRRRIRYTDESYTGARETVQRGRYVSRSVCPSARARARACVCGLVLPEDNRFPLRYTGPLRSGPVRSRLILIWRSRVASRRVGSAR